jgi:hypothetical protein
MRNNGSAWIRVSNFNIQLGSMKSAEKVELARRIQCSRLQPERDGELVKRLHPSRMMFSG